MIYVQTKLHRPHKLSQFHYQGIWSPDTKHSLCIPLYLSSISLNVANVDRRDTFCERKAPSKRRRSSSNQYFSPISFPNCFRFSWRTRRESIPNRWKRIRRRKLSWKKFLDVCKKNPIENILFKKNKTNYVSLQKIN